MLSFQTNGPCLNCNSVKETLKLVDKKLDNLAKTHLAQITHLSSKKLDLHLVHDLIYYKQMLTHLQFNTAYYEPCVTDIISKVKTIAL